MTPALATLVVGIVIGYLGQRSRLCFIAGYRDYLLMRDFELLKGVGGALLGAFVGYLVFNILGGAVPEFPLLVHRPDLIVKTNWLWVISLGMGLGFVGALAGGCPFRMHVLAAEGKTSYWFYLLGLYAGLLLCKAVPVRHMIQVAFLHK